MIKPNMPGLSGLELRMILEAARIGQSDMIETDQIHGADGPALERALSKLTRALSEYQTDVDARHERKERQIQEWDHARGARCNYRTCVVCGVAE